MAGARERAKWRQTADPGFSNMLICPSSHIIVASDEDNNGDEETAKSKEGTTMMG
jgi:hypothetical protein